MCINLVREWDFVVVLRYIPSLWRVLAIYKKESYNLAPCVVIVGVVSRVLEEKNHLNRDWNARKVFESVSRLKLKDERRNHQSTLWKSIMEKCRNRRRSAAVVCFIWAAQCRDRARMACREFRSRWDRSTQWRVRAKRKASTVGWVSGRMASYSRMSTRIASKWHDSFPSSRCTIVPQCVKCSFQNVAMHTLSRNFYHSIRHSHELREFNIRPFLLPFWDVPQE